MNRVRRLPKNTVRSQGAWYYGDDPEPDGPRVAAQPKPMMLRGKYGVQGVESTRTRLPEARRVDPNARFV
jgi:hypothetical protein